MIIIKAVSSSVPKFKKFPIMVANSPNGREIVGDACTSLQQLHQRLQRLTNHILPFQPQCILLMIISKLKMPMSHLIINNCT